MTDYDPAADSFNSYQLARQLQREKLLREGTWKAIGPRNEEERAIAEGRDMTIEEVIASGNAIPREGRPGPAHRNWPVIWEIIVRAAFEGAPCPRNEQIARQAGMRYEDTVAKAIRRAAGCGFLRQERHKGARRIILHTGQATGWSIRAYRPGQMDTAMAEYIRRRKQDQERRKDGILAMLVDCVHRDAPPPTNEAIAGEIGCNVKTVTESLHALIADGRLIQQGHAMGRSFMIPGVGTTARKPKVKTKAAPKPRKPRKKREPKATTGPRAKSKANWYMLPASEKDRAYRTAMLDRAERVDAVDVPATADNDHAAMLARFLARGGKPMKCPDGFAAVRSIHEVLA